MQAQTAVVPAPSLAARRALAVVLGAALVAIAAQIAVLILRPSVSPLRARL